MNTNYIGRKFREIIGGKTKPEEEPETSVSTPLDVKYVGSKLEDILAEKEAEKERINQEHKAKQERIEIGAQQFKTSVLGTIGRLVQFGSQPEISRFLEKADIILCKNSYGADILLYRDASGRVNVGSRDLSFDHSGYRYDAIKPEHFQYIGGEYALKTAHQRYGSLLGVTTDRVAQRILEGNVKEWVLFK